MRNVLVVTYMLGALVMAYAVFSHFPRPDKPGIVVGGAVVVAVAVINSIQRRRNAPPETISGLKTRPQRRPLRAFLWLLAVFSAAMVLLVDQSPYAGVAPYFRVAMMLIYVALIGADLLSDQRAPGDTTALR